ncbi:DUF2169 domain-containing protein [Caballeronia sp. LZ019]|uniref:DUF2169 family type VI secretion system accessory protein n=1 Tax=Caballeronia sp. LZ019 TaxID=3038555 RepID=UPI0028583456|nr:DUF2169 domain-containing protein [Caballeronia sp. LZ019]MDR5809814.1 DUF2169 domain-containing protein [Caballeronia sp. LZ019]
MWTVHNDTPYKVGKTWVRNKEGIHQWIVVVKATYEIKSDGTTVLADEQLDPLLLPEYRGEPGLSSLRYDADLVAPKPTTDILLNGTAYAPHGRWSSDFLVGLRVGAIRKVLRVRGEREWVCGLFGARPSEARPVLSVPIIYERAFGGYDRTSDDVRNHCMDARNPVGRGVCAVPDHRKGQALANLEYPDGDVEHRGPACFGAIDSFWSPRREYAGTYDEIWRDSRAPLLPADWDSRSLLSAPPDQRPVNHLTGREPVVLVNLTPSGRLSFDLPRVYLTFSTQIATHAEAHRSRLATVIIEPDHPRVIMVWQTSLDCRTNVEYLEKTVVREKEMIS